MSQQTRIVRICLVGVVASMLLATAASGTVAAQDERINIDVEDNYNGISEDGQQNVELSVTLTAQETTSEIEVEFSPTAQSLLDIDTFEVTVSDVEFENPEPGVYVINELSAGQEITFTFDAYPKRLDREEMNVASVSLDAENPQTYERSERLSADMSSSPWLQYQEAASEGFPLWISVAGGLFGILGIVVGGYFLYSKRKSINQKEEEFVETLRSIRGNLEYTEDQQVVSEEIEEREGGGLGGL